MRSNYKRLGDFITQVNVRNTDGKITDLRGLSLVKNFRKSTSNTVGANMTKYKVMQQWQFSANFMGLGVLVDKAAIVLKTDEQPNIVSSAYPVFEVIDQNLLHPEYLMMWFRRSEFDRYCVFKSDKGIRGGFDWNDLCEVELPVPSIEKQQEIVKEYNTIVNRIKLNEQLNQKLEETAQALYKHWFVDFEFPNENGKPYKSSGGEMVYNEEFDKEIPSCWSSGLLSDISFYTTERIKIDNLNIASYISTENMLPDRRGVEAASSLPNGKSTTKYEVGDVLISNIRPYFKKIWLATYDGGCSNDILCIKPNGLIDSSYLYFLLETDEFFNYVMKGAKGTKMPRGDKNWIMNYPVALSPKEITEQFSALMEGLIRNRDLNRRQIEVLKDLATVLLSKMASLN